MNLKTGLFFALIILVLCYSPRSLVWGWTWNSGENVMPSLKEDFDRDVASYREQVGKGMGLHDRIVAVDRIIDNYKPMGINVSDLETESSRLVLQEKQQQLASVQARSEATLLYDKGVAEYKEGLYQQALATFQDAERLIPHDDSVKEIRRKLEGIVPVVEAETGSELDSVLIRLSLSHYLENDSRRALNALIYASEKNTERADMMRLRRLIETNSPDVDRPHLAQGTTLVETKLQLSLEAIYEGRFLNAISECGDVLDLEPHNVMAMTRLGSAYYAMNEKDKAKQIWVKALQMEPGNATLKKFIYGQQNVKQAPVLR